MQYRRSVPNPQSPQSFPVAHQHLLSGHIPLMRFEVSKATTIIIKKKQKRQRGQNGKFLYLLNNKNET